MKRLSEKYEGMNVNEELIMYKEGLRIKKMDDGRYAVGIGNENRIRAYFEKSEVYTSEVFGNCVADIMEGDERKETILIMRVD